MVKQTTMMARRRNKPNILESESKLSPTLSQAQELSKPKSDQSPSFGLGLFGEPHCTSSYLDSSFVLTGVSVGENGARLCGAMKRFESL